MDSVYRERAHLVAHLAAVYPSALVPGADPSEPAWPVVFIELPTGQLSWHVSPDDVDLFAHVDTYGKDTPGRPEWDGHSTEEKYGRLGAHTAALSEA